MAEQLQISYPATRVRSEVIVLLAACDEGSPVCQGDPDGSVAPPATRVVCSATVNHYRPSETVVDGDIVWTDELLASFPYLAPALVNETGTHFSPGSLHLAGCRVMVQAMPTAGVVWEDALGTVVDHDDPDCIALDIERAFDVGEDAPMAGRTTEGGPLEYGDLRFYGLVPNPGGAVEGSYTVTGLTCITIE